MGQVAMRQHVFPAVVAACLMIGAGRQSHAQTNVQSESPAPVALTLSCRVAHPHSIALAELRDMAAVTVEVSHAGHDGTRVNRYTGVLLWTLLEAAEPVDVSGPRTHLQHTLRATGQDGYTVALAIGEIEPGFEGKQVMVAYEEDGRALPRLRLIVPSDAKAGRSVRDLVSIDVE